MKPFVPHKLPPPGLDWERLAKPIGKANVAVSFYNELSRKSKKREWFQ